MKAYGYACPTCKKGIVDEEIIYDYNMKIKDRNYYIGTVRLGICSKCKIKYFSSNEKRKIFKIVSQYEVNRLLLALRDNDIVLAKDIGLILKSLIDEC